MKQRMEGHERREVRGERKEEGRGVDFAAPCCHALCCVGLWTKNLLLKAYDLPQWFDVFCFS